MTVIMYSVNRIFKEITVRYPAAETAEKHARILDAAAQAYRRRGFSGVSVSDIMKATGLTHGPFYNHFSSKEALIAETLGHISNSTVDLTDAFEKSERGKANFVRAYLSDEHRSDPGNGCLMATLGAEVAREPAFKPTYTRHVTGIVARMVDRFPWSSKESARKEALRTLAAMVGAVVLARAVNDQELATEILNEVAAGLLKA